MFQFLNGKIDQTTNFTQGAHYESTYNVNYKGEVRTQYLGFREKNNFYCPVSDKGSENCNQSVYSLED